MEMIFFLMLATIVLLIWLLIELISLLNVTRHYLHNIQESSRDTKFLVNHIRQLKEETTKNGDNKN
jgi:hypothetical protein